MFDEDTFNNRSGKTPLKDDGDFLGSPRRADRVMQFQTIRNIRLSSRTLLANPNSAWGTATEETSIYCRCARF
jgi:hypothetical protein